MPGENDKELLHIFHDKQSAYHDQKENIVYIVLGAELTLLTSILGLNKWPPEKLMSLVCANATLRMSAVIIFFFLLLTIHYIIRRQLILRRAAAIDVKIITNALCMAGNDPQTEQSEIPAPKSAPLDCIGRFFDYLVPTGVRRHRTDSDETDYKNFINRFVGKDNKKLQRTSSATYEWLISLASIASLLGIAFYTLR